MSAPPTNATAQPSTSAAAATSHRRACAFCHYMRRRCEDNCPTAPYFPASEWGDMLNAHKLFGRSYIVKALRDAPPELRDETAKSLKYEANTRAMDPVHGCLGVTRQLQMQLRQQTMELQNTRNQLQFYRSMQQHQYPFMPNYHQDHHHHHQN